MTEVFLGDTGTEIVLDCGVNVTTATVRKIVARKQNGVKVTWLASLDGTNAIKYTTTEFDLDVAGTWYLQAYVEMPNWKGYGGKAMLTVSKPI